MPPGFAVCRSFYVWSPGFSRPGLGGAERGIVSESSPFCTRCRLKPGLHTEGIRAPLVIHATSFLSLELISFALLPRFAIHTTTYICRRLESPDAARQIGQTGRDVRE